MDRQFYQERYPDVVASGVDLAEHFADYGLGEPIRSLSKRFEAALLIASPALLLALACRGKRRSDVEDIYAEQMRRSCARGGAVRDLLGYATTQALIRVYGVRGRVGRDAAAQERRASVLRLQECLAEFSRLSPRDHDRAKAAFEGLTAVPVLLRAFGASKSPQDRVRYIETIVDRARTAYRADRRLLYWLYERALARLTHGPAAGGDVRSGAFVARQVHPSTLSAADCSANPAFRFAEGTPIGQPHLYGQPHEPNTTHLPDRPIRFPSLIDATLFARSNTVLLSSGGVLNETGGSPQQERKVLHASDRIVIGKSGTSFALDISGYDIVELDRAVMLCGVASNAYGHWLSDYISRLEFLEQHASFATSTIVVDDDMPQSHYDLLGLITKNDIYRLPRSGAVRAASLLYSCPLTFFPVHLMPHQMQANELNAVNPQSYRFIKARVERGLPKPSGPHRKIFLSRRTSTWRRLANDTDVAGLLSKEGYETIIIENYDFAEQVRIFQEASHIVAANGSALQNVIFCDPSVRLLILAHPELNNWGAFNAQVGALGFQMEFLCGHPSNVGGVHADYEIPLPILADAVDKHRHP